MAKRTLFWSGQRVMERWGIDSTELAAHIYQGLPALHMKEGKFFQVPPEEVNNFDADHMTNFVFDPDAVLTFEKEHGLSAVEDSDLEKMKLPAKEARELGLLRTQKETMDISIGAAVQVGIFCAETDRPVIRKEIQDLVNNLDLKITDTSIDMMWNSIPQNYKKGPGRPKKE